MDKHVLGMSEEEKSAYYREKNEKKRKNRLQAETPDAIIYWGTGKKHKTFLAYGKLVNLQWIKINPNYSILASYVKCGSGLKRKIFYCDSKTAENQFLVMKRNTIVQMYGYTTYYIDRQERKVMVHRVIEVGQFATHPRLSEVMSARESLDEKLWKKVNIKGQEEEINDVLQFLGMMNEDEN